MALTSRLLYLAERVSAQELHEKGLIAHLISADNADDKIPSLTFQQLLINHLTKSTEMCSMESIMTSKAMVKPERLRKTLRDVNHDEMRVRAHMARECVEYDPDIRHGPRW